MLMSDKMQSFIFDDHSITIPGSPETDLSERGKSVIRRTLTGRYGNFEDLLGTIDCLLDDRSSAYITSQTVAIDGGFLAHAGV